MRITKDTVTRVAGLAEKISDGAFSLGFIRSDPSGIVYSDGVKAFSWRGKTGAREASAYYLGVFGGYFRVTDVWLTQEDYDFLDELHETIVLNSPKKIATQYELGHSDAALKISSLIEA